MEVFDIVVVICAICGLIMVLGSLYLLFKGSITFNDSSGGPTSVELKEFKFSTHTPVLTLFIIGLTFLYVPIVKSNEMQKYKIDKQSLVNQQANDMEKFKIEEQNKSSLQINAKINLIKSDSTPIAPQIAADLLSKLQPTIDPPIISGTNGHVTLFIPQELLNISKVTFAIPNFGQGVTMVKSDFDKIKANGKIIELGTITLMQYGNAVSPYPTGCQHATKLHPERITSIKGLPPQRRVPVIQKS